MPLKAQAGVRKRTPLLVLAALCLCGGGAGRSQRGSGTSSMPSSTGGTVNSNSSPSSMPSLDMGPEEPQSMRVLRQNARRDDIKKRMTQNATRLLLLTAELRADLQTREPTEADGKRLEEIARLAHAVREQMKQ